MLAGRRVTRGGGGGITDPMAAVRAQAQAATSVSTAPRPQQTYTAPRPQPARPAPQPPPPQQPAYPSFIPSPEMPSIPQMPQMPIAAPQPAAAQVEPAMAGLQQAMDQEPGVGWGAEGAMGADPRLGQRSVPTATRILSQLARVY
jgi:hypothetical protein